MLEFSDAPYQFFPSQPSRPLIWLGRRLNQLFTLPGKNHLISEIALQGELSALAEARAQGDRLLFILNHPSHSDPQVITEVHRRLGIPSVFMAAYDVFLRSPFTAWSMQKLGHFSIDREGSDRKAMSAAIDILKEGDYALTIFPEGNVYLTNDRVTPFLDGTAFIALKAQQACDTAAVKVVPLALKFTHLTDVRPLVFDRLEQLAASADVEFSPGLSALDKLVLVGRHLLARHLSTHGFAEELHPDKEDLHTSLRNIVEKLCHDLEDALSLDHTKEAELGERIRKIRSRIHQLRTDSSTPSDNESLLVLADKAILAYRVHAYLVPYATAHPSLDRYAETVERLSEDFWSATMPPTGYRKAIVQIQTPIDIPTYLTQAGGKLRQAVQPLTTAMEDSVKEGLALINQQNRTIGTAGISHDQGA